MPVDKTETVTVRTSEDVVAVRQRVRAHAAEAGFNLVEQTKLVTAASELARNMVDFASGGTALIETVRDDSRVGVRCTFEDHGPGIPDVELAMRDGFTTGRGLGYGLGGAKRLVNQFSLETEAGKGTRVTIARWR